MQLFRITLLLCTIAGINGLRLGRRQTDGCYCAGMLFDVKKLEVDLTESQAKHILAPTSPKAFKLQRTKVLGKHSRIGQGP
jgi:hypothetical protein